MSNDTSATRREIFAAIAQLATRDLLPVPTNIAFSDTSISLELERILDLNAWVDELGAVCGAEIIDGGMIVAIGSTMYMGWRLWLRAAETVRPGDTTADAVAR